VRQQGAVDDAVRRHGHEALRRGAVAPGLFDRAVTDPGLRIGVGPRVRGRHHGRDDRAAHQPEDRRAAHATAPHRDRHGADDGEADRQEHRVVDARQQLEQQRAGAQQAVAHAAGVEQPMPGPQRQRHPLRPLQLEVLQVHPSIRREGEHEAGDDRGTAMIGQPGGEAIGEVGRADQSNQREHVGDGIGSGSEPDERSADQALQQDRVGIGECPPLGPENVAVEQGACAAQLVRDPAQPPRRERRIEVCRGQLGQRRGQRPRERNTENRVKKDDGELGSPRPDRPFTRPRRHAHAKMRSIGKMIRNPTANSTGGA
jgi:hypothetical protein